MEGVHILSKSVTLTFEEDFGLNTIFVDKLLFIYYLIFQFGSIIFHKKKKKTLKFRIKMIKNRKVWYQDYLFFKKKTCSTNIKLMQKSI